MAFVVADRVKETSTSTGTGTITLAGAVTGFQSFAAVGNGNTTYYCIASQSANEWEVGLGTYTSSGTTLARTTVLSSSNGGSLVNFSAGTKDVFVTYPAGYSVYSDGTRASGTWAINISGNAATASSASAVAWGNVTSKPSNIMYYQGFTLDANTMDPNATGFTYSVNAPFTGPIARFSTGGSYDLWLNAPYSSGGYGLAFRTRNGDTGTLNSWQYPAVYNINANGGGALYATSYYDSNDTSYYIDPASTSDSALRMRGGALFGPNTTWSAYLYVGTNGNPGTSSASVCTTNGNLHLDAADGYALYLNYYSTNSYTIASQSIRSPIFYDLNNTGYYVDPASTSNLNGLTVASTISGSISGNAATATTATALTGGDSNFYGLLYNALSGNLNTYNNPGLISAEYTGSTNRPTASNGHYIQISDAGGTDVKTQWYFPSSGVTPYMRLMWGNANWLSWQALLTSGNYNSYAPTLTGTGASGTWPINVTGSAGSATTATTATNIAGGAANRIPYQTGAGATSFITAPTVSSTYLQWNGTAFTWAAAGGGAAAGGAVYENTQTISSNYTMTTNYNGVSAGPITINTGVTVTIPTGSNWSIV